MDLYVKTYQTQHYEQATVFFLFITIYAFFTEPCYQF